VKGLPSEGMIDKVGDRESELEIRRHGEMGRADKNRLREG